MSAPSRMPAVLAYVPVLGWLFVFFAHRRNPLAVYHLKQSIGLVLFLITTSVGWAVVGWVLAWIPYLFIVSIALFALVIAAFIFGLVAWLLGVRNALSAQLTPLPLFGEWANHLAMNKWNNEQMNKLPNKQMEQ